VGLKTAKLAEAALFWAYPLLPRPLNPECRDGAGIFERPVSHALAQLQRFTKSQG
jgi:hypothetical protein